MLILYVKSVIINSVDYSHKSLQSMEVNLVSLVLFRFDFFTRILFPAEALSYNVHHYLLIGEYLAQFHIYKYLIIFYELREICGTND